MTQQQQLRDRTKTFARDIIQLCRSLPNEWGVRELGKQLLRAGTSVASNYRACGRARSDKEFCSRMGVVVEEADESQLWLELLPDAYPAMDPQAHAALLREGGELVAIFGAAHRTAKNNLEKRKSEKRKARPKNSAPA